MDEYLINFDDYEKIVIYDFQLGYGGIGDCIKYFMFILEKCICEKMQCRYLINNIAIENYLKLKYEKMYISRNEIPQLKKTYKIENPFHLYNTYNDESITIPIQDVFYFSNEIIDNKNNIFSNINSYTCIHLRLGDKFLETNKSNVICKNDTRSFNESEIFDFIEKNKDTNIVFCCDNKNYKTLLKKRFENIHLVNCVIGHTSLKNTTTKQILDTVTEFYIMCNSEKIVAASRSGFSIIASKFKNIEYIILNTKDNEDHKMQIENNEIMLKKISNKRNLSINLNIFNTNNGIIDNKPHNQPSSLSLTRYLR